MFNRKRKLRKHLLNYGKSNRQNNTNYQKRGDAQFKKRIHPTIRKLKRVFSVVTIAGIAGLLIYWLFFSGYFVVKEFTSEDQEEQNQVLAEQLEDTIKSALGKNIILLDTEELEQKILESFPQLEKIKVKKSYPKTLKLEFSEYPMVANVINESSNLKKNYILNSIGFAVKEDYENPQLPFIRLQTDEPVNPEIPVIEASVLTQILDTKTYFEEKFGMKVTEIIYKPIPREIHLVTERNFAIWLDSQKSTEEQLKKLKKVLVKLDIYTMDLQYIDLRIAGGNGDKIIYKRK